MSTFFVSRSWVYRYAAAIAMVAGITLLRVPLGPLLGNSVPFILYFTAVTFAAWLAGFGPGLAATLLSGYCAKTWFFEPRGSFAIPDAGSAFRLLLFVLCGILISFLCGRLHQRTAELQKEKALLEAKVRERTLTLERAYADMEAFSYTVSHDLRAPLRTLHGFSEILLDEHAALLKPEARSLLERIHNAALRLDRLTNDLLALAKVSGAQIEMRAIALREAVGGVVESSPRWGSPDVSISYEGCQHTVLGNHTLLMQVLQNLLENAVKFVAPGVRPKVRFWSEVRGEVVRLWIADNGIGIAPADQQRLFKIFERGDAKTYAGTGIGLTIVDRAVAKMHGRIGLESEVGVGTRFWVELARG